MRNIDKTSNLRYYKTNKLYKPGTDSSPSSNLGVYTPRTLIAALSPAWRGEALLLKSTSPASR
jgi:hypothetical protein